METKEDKLKKLNLLFNRNIEVGKIESIKVLDVKIDEEQSIVFADILLNNKETNWEFRYKRANKKTGKNQQYDLTGCKLASKSYEDGSEFYMVCINDGKFRKIYKYFPTKQEAQLFLDNKETMIKKEEVKDNLTNDKPVETKCEASKKEEVNSMNIKVEHPIIKEEIKVKKELPNMETRKKLWDMDYLGDEFDEKYDVISLQKFNDKVSRMKKQFDEEEFAYILKKALEEGSDKELLLKFPSKFRIYIKIVRDILGDNGIKDIIENAEYLMNVKLKK